MDAAPLPPRPRTQPSSIVIPITCEESLRNRLPLTAPTPSTALSPDTSRPVSVQQLGIPSVEPSRSQRVEQLETLPPQTLPNRYQRRQKRHYYNGDVTLNVTSQSTGALNEINAIQNVVTSSNTVDASNEEDLESVVTSQSIDIGIPDILDHIGHSVPVDSESGSVQLDSDEIQADKRSFWCRSARRRWCLCWVIFISVLVVALMSAIITLQVMHFSSSDSAKSVIPYNTTSGNRNNITSATSQWQLSTNNNKTSKHYTQSTIQMTSHQSSTLLVPEAITSTTLPSTDSQIRRTTDYSRSIMSTLQFSTYHSFFNPSPSPSPMKTDHAIKTQSTTDSTNKIKENIKSSKAKDLQMDIKTLITLLILALFVLGVLLVVGALMIAKGCCKCITDKSQSNNRSTVTWIRNVRNSINGSNHHLNQGQSRISRIGSASSERTTTTSLAGSTDSTLQLQTIEEIEEEQPEADDRGSISSGSNCSVIISYASLTEPAHQSSDVPNEPPPPYASNNGQASMEHIGDVTSTETSTDNTLSAADKLDESSLPSYDEVQRNVVNCHLPRYEDISHGGTNS